MNNLILIQRITEWIQDEAANELPKNYGCIIGKEEEKAEREQVLMERFLSRSYMSTPEFLLRIQPIRYFLTRRTVKKAESFIHDMMGECLLKETDGVDAILLYPDRILKFYYDVIAEETTFTPDLSELEELSRSFTRHECRHACQFTELRKLETDPSDVLAWEFMEFKYGEGMLERDAFQYQLQDTSRSVAEVCREIKTVMGISES